MKIAIYSRKSKFTGKGESIENQIDMCYNYIHDNLPECKDSDIFVYEDEGFSAKNLDRPQFKAMMDDLEKQHFDYIVVYRLDRISRNVSDFSNLVEGLNRKGVSFICIKERFDTSTPMGRAMMYIASVFAQLERETIAERVRDNMQMLAKTGRWLGGTTPLGYSSEKVEGVDSTGKKRSHYKLVENDDRNKVELIFRKFLETQSQTATTAYLIANDIKTATNADFTNIGVREIIRNPVYCEVTQESYDYFVKLGCQMCFGMSEVDGRYGFSVYNRKKSDNTGKRIGENEPTEWIVALGCHDPMVSAKDWLKSQEIININKKYSFHRKVHNKDSLLSGILYCKNCGHKMRPKINSRVKADGTKSFFYMCEHKEFSRRSKCDVKNVNGELLDKLVCDAILSYDDLASPIHEQLNSLHDSIRDVSSEKDDRRKALDSKIESTQTKIKNLIGTLAMSSSDDTIYGYVKAEIDNLDKQLKELKSEKTLIESQSEEVLDYNEQYNVILDLLCDFKKTFHSMSVVQKRDVLRTIISRVEWDGENADIFLIGATQDSSEV